MALGLALLIPWASGVVLLVMDGRRPRVGWIAVAVLGATLVCLASVALAVSTSGPIVVVTGDWPQGVGITLRADALGTTFALLSVAMLASAAVHELLEGAQEREFYGLVLLLATGLIGAFLTGDLFNFYVFFELALVSSYVLSVDGRTSRGLGAGLIFTAVNLVGTFVFLLSVASIYRVTGTLDMARIAERMAGADPNAAILIAVGFFVAFSVKLGLFPFHFWLPPVYARSRPVVAAILSGSLANIGAYGLLRFGGELLPRELELAAVALIVLGSASIIYGGVLAIARRTPGEMLAYSAIGQVGYVLVAVGIGGPVGFAAAVVYTVVNALNKTMLFLVTRHRGAVVGAAFAIGALSVAGIPPAAGFVAKLSVFRSVADSPALIVLVVLGSLLSCIYVFQMYQQAHWRTDDDTPMTGWRSHAVPLVLAIAIIAVGLWPEPLVAVSQAAAQALTGPPP